MMQNVTILGSTGSIGENTLDVISHHPEKFRVFALTAKNNIKKLAKQCMQFQPRYAVLIEPGQVNLLQKILHANNCKTEILLGERALIDVASDPEVDSVMAAIVGGAGLQATLAAVTSNKRTMLANKEALVMAGPLFMQAVHDNNALLLPVDSEHNAIFQCMPSDYLPGKTNKLKPNIEKILLTASGGPFRTWPIEKLKSVTPEQAVAHPNWSMGKKISVDSATMFNKGLEVIEAHFLFNVELNDIEVILHPQSIIHSMVTYADGSVLAQLSNPDMRTPIAYALSWPERINAGVEPLNLITAAKLEFEQLNLQQYPCLKLAYQAMNAGGTAPVILNAANEVGVAAFLNQQIAFTDIEKIIADALERIPARKITSLEDILNTDRTTRSIAISICKTIGF